MAFLNPWFWLGALALAAPIWLHLRRRRESNLVRFSTLRFLDDQPEPRRGPLRLRDLLLFALRVMALLLLIAAFAWPYLRGPNSTPIKESRVYVLDNTMSHQANDGFTHDRDRVLSELARAGPDVQCAVIELSSSPRTVAGFGEDREAARERVRALQPSFQRGSFLAAFRQANALLGNSLGDRKRIIFLSDNQENQWSENIDTPPFLANVEVELPKPATPALPNVLLSEPRAQRIFLGDKSLVNFTVKLGHIGPAQNAKIALRANDQIIFNKTVELEKQPESTLLQAQWEAEPASWLRGEVSLEAAPDALAADNHVFFSLAPVVEGKVALLAQSPYLRLALSPEILRGQWATRTLDPARLAAELADNHDADVLCLESSYLQSADARKLLWRYLSNGRGVVLFINRLTPSINGCLRELGFEPEGTVASERGAAGKFQFVMSNHPIFHPFLSPDYGNLMDIKVSKYARLKTSQAMPLVFGEKGDALFFQGTKTAGKLLVAAFGMDRDHTSWPIHQTFIPFLDLTLQTARADDPTPINFEPGEITMLHLPPDSGVRQVVLRDDQRQWDRAAVEQGRAQLHLPDRPGLYSLSYDANTQVEKVFSVNPSPKESQLAFVEYPEAMAVWRLPRAAELATSPAPSNAGKISMAGILQQDYWWGLLVAGLLALMLEMVVGARRRSA